MLKYLNKVLWAGQRSSVWSRVCCGWQHPPTAAGRLRVTVRSLSSVVALSAVALVDALGERILPAYYDPI
jgi:hypothetical protein